MEAERLKKKKNKPDQAKIRNKRVLLFFCAMPARTNRFHASRNEFLDLLVGFHSLLIRCC